MAPPFAIKLPHTKWYLRWMCLVRERNCGSLLRMMAAMLPLPKWWAAVEGVQAPQKNVQSHARCWPSPMYSDSVVDRAIIDCHLLAQPITLWLAINTYLKVEREVSTSRDKSASAKPWNTKLPFTSLP